MTETTLDSVLAAEPKEPQAAQQPASATEKSATAEEAKNDAGTAETATEPQSAVPEEEHELTDEEAQAILEEDLQRLMVERAPEVTHSDPATLEDMVAEARIMRKRGIAFHLVPPVIEELSKIIKLFNKMEECGANGDETGIIACAVELGRRLMWVMDGSSLRMAREEELRRCFGPLQLATTISTILVEQGLEINPEKK